MQSWTYDMVAMKQKVQLQNFVGPSLCRCLSSLFWVLSYQPSTCCVLRSQVIQFSTKSVSYSIILMYRLVSLVISMMDNWFWLIGGVKIQNRRIIVSRLFTLAGSHEKKMPFLTVDIRDINQKGRNPDESNPKHSSFSLAVLKRETAVCFRFVSLDPSLQRWPFQSFESISLGEEYRTPKSTISLPALRGPKDRKIRNFIKIICGRRLVRISTTQRCTSFGCRGKLSVWHLYGIFLFSLLDEVFILSKPKKNEIIGLSLSSSTETTKTIFSSTVNKTEQLSSIEYPPKKKHVHRYHPNDSSVDIPRRIGCCFRSQLHPPYRTRQVSCAGEQHGSHPNMHGYTQERRDCCILEGEGEFWCLGVSLPMDRNLGKKCSPFAIFLLVLSLSNLFFVGTAMGLLQRRKLYRDSSRRWVLI